jgi:hypothetical protein
MGRKVGDHVLMKTLRVSGVMTMCNFYIKVRREVEQVDRDAASIYRTSECLDEELVARIIAFVSTVRLIGAKPTRDLKDKSVFRIVHD